MLMLVATVALIVIAFVHFVPTVIAYRRRHPRMGAIFMVNLLLGWTVFGWIAALIWSLSDPKVYP